MDFIFDKSQFEILERNLKLEGSDTKDKETSSPNLVSYSINPDTKFSISVTREGFFFGNVEK
jgi:hypothetical protein